MTADILQLDFELFNDRFEYDPTIGGSGLIYKKDILSGTRPIKKGTVAGCKHKHYWVVAINKKQYKAHRIVWLLYYKKDFESYIDHINRDGFDNRIENLRLATCSENGHNRSVPKNNKSGFIGVCLDKKTNKWKASIMINGCRKFLGSYATPEEAFDMYLKEKKSIFNEHTNKQHKAPSEHRR